MYVVRSHHKIVQAIALAIEVPKSTFNKLFNPRHRQNG